MTAAVDLGPAIADMEAQMVDRCRIVRGRPGTADDELDPITLQLVVVDGPAVYEGPCLVSGFGGTKTQDVTVGAEQEQVSTGALRIPLRSTADVQHGDRVYLLAVKWAPALAGQVFRIEDEIAKTLAVSRTFQLEARRV